MADQISRRVTLKALLLAGCSPVWLEVFSGCSARLPPRSVATWTPRFLTPHWNETVTVLSELILPETDTPGARTARVNEFIDALLFESGDGERDRFVAQLEWLDERAKARHQAVFVDIGEQRQVDMLHAMSALVDRHTSGRRVQGHTGPTRSMQGGSIYPILTFAPDTPEDDRTAAELFQSIKTMTILGYYTSEVGTRYDLGETREALRYPYSYAGCQEEDG